MSITELNDKVFQNKSIQNSFLNGAFPWDTVLCDAPSHW